MDKLLIILCVIFAVGISIIAFPEAISALLIVTIFTFVTIVLIRRYSDDYQFLIRVFIVGLLARLILGAFIYVYDLYDFFGPDARLYDLWGQRIVEVWFGQANMLDQVTQDAVGMSGPGWGMNYLTAFIYLIFGQNMLAVQSLCGFTGAATIPAIYFCAKNIYFNQKVARISALSIALFPSFIIWSSQILKDGLIIFLLVLAITMVFQLQKKFSYAPVVLLIFSLFGIISLRFYIFYMVAVAITGSFILGTSKSTQSIAKRTIALTLVGLVLTYLGVARIATTEFERFGTYDRFQLSREYASGVAGSGYINDDADVTTLSGVISALPLGFTYLMFAPFPWQVSNFRQAITLPEIFLWWALMPFLLSGLWYTLNNRLRNAIPVLIFSLLLTLVYALYQGNVGTAYRQRTQIQVFLFIFIAVGWSLIQERRENQKIARLAKRQEQMNRIKQREML